MVDLDDGDFGDLSKIPNFIPPHAQVLKQEVADVKLRQDSEREQIIEGKFIGSGVDKESFWIELQTSSGDVRKVTASEMGWVRDPDDIQKCIAMVQEAKPKMGDAVILKSGLSEGCFEVVGVAADKAHTEAASKVEKVSLDVKAEMPAIGASGSQRRDAEAWHALLNEAKNVVSSTPVVDPNALRDVNAQINKSALANLTSQIAREESIADNAKQSVNTLARSDGPPQMKSGGQALVDGVGAVIGGAAALLGSAGALVGGEVHAVARGVRSVGEALKAGSKSSVGGDSIKPPGGDGGDTVTMAGVNVLPRLSDYRLDQVERSANAYVEACEKFWQCDQLSNIKQQIEERARLTGISVQDVMEKMKPNGEMADLCREFNAAVKESPDAMSFKQSMDKALDAWGRQHGRASEELLNPEQEEDFLDAAKGRIDNAKKRLEGAAASMPGFDGEDKTHLERMREIVARIAEKLKEFVIGAVGFISGKKAEVENEPSL